MQHSTERRYRDKYLPWNIETIRQDHSKDFVASIRKYDGYCFFPAHVDYKRVHGNFMNMYEPLPYASAPGEFPHIRVFLEHIFREQLELGLDYIQLLYLRPKQRLPILLLVSQLRNTGKTTFIHFLQAVFGGNATINTNEDFKSNFNSEWASKLIIATDEVLLNRLEDSERFKTLSTARTFKLEAKGKDRTEIEFFGKFVLCSNNENNPVLIEPGEIRYWVRRITPIKNENTAMLDRMKEEIPAFLYFLLHRELSAQEESRMWFNPKLLETPALRWMIQYNRGQLENEMLCILEDIFHVHEGDQCVFCVGYADDAQRAGYPLGTSENKARVAGGLEAETGQGATVYLIPPFGRRYALSGTAHRKALCRFPRVRCRKSVIL